MRTAEEIDALLPQTQCTRCGYAGCRPYAQAIASGEAGINQCPPGGAAVIEALACLLGCDPLPLNPANGAHTALMVAQIDESRCIGCAKCLPPCPVDAILGASRQMHTVIAELCTGCELCVAPCPVDCISMVPRATLPIPPAAPPILAEDLAAGPALGMRANSAAALAALHAAARGYRHQFEQRNARIERRAQERAALLQARKNSAHAPQAPAGVTSESP